MMGVQLAALLLAGRGAAWVTTRGIRLLTTRVPRWPPGLSPAAALLAAIVVLAPAWLQLGAYDHHDGAAIAAQRRADHTQGAQLDRLIAAIQRDGGARTYAGMPSNWGQNLTVGTVPVFKYLESRDVDEVGYTLRTASLMTDPESYFDDRNPSDYRLFAIRYLILPTSSRPPVSAALKLRAGRYSLWTLPDATGVLSTATIVGSLSADRSDIGTRTIPVLRSDLARHERYEQVRFDQSGSAIPTRSTRSSSLAPARRSAGAVFAQTDHLTAGRAAATVAMRRSGVVVLSASFDPGWSATVDGRSQPTRMVAPALVATTVQAGIHRVVFRYRGFRGYPLLLALGAGALLALLCAEIAHPRASARYRGRALWRPATGPPTPQAEPAAGRHGRR
jgi:hypothetical protein